MAELSYRIATRSHPGHVRPSNLDRWLVARSPTAGAALVGVADGMGREPSSGLAAEQVLAVCRPADSPPGQALHHHAELPIERRRELLQAGCRLAWERLQELAREDPERGRMGTTLVLALLAPDGVTYLYAGDSRLYWLRPPTLVRVSQDHSVVSVLIQLGRLHPEQASHHPMQGQLTSFLGPTLPWDQVELGPTAATDASFVPEPGDLLLLCTDGVHGYLTAGELLGALTGPGPVEERADALLAAVLASPAGDNATFVLVEVEAAP